MLSRREGILLPDSRPAAMPKHVSAVAAAALVFLLLFYLVSCIYMAADLFSNPSVVLMSRDRMGNRLVIDDFREAYTWMRMNTDPSAKIASWWDYGYAAGGGATGGCRGGGAPPARSLSSECDPACMSRPDVSALAST